MGDPTSPLKRARATLAGWAPAPLARRLAETVDWWVQSQREASEREAEREAAAERERALRNVLRERRMRREEELRDPSGRDLIDT